MKVLVFGTFDGLHPGHCFVLEQALKTGETYVVVARDRNVERIKKRAPLHHEEERKRTVADAFPAAHVLLGEMEDFLLPLTTLKPDLILLGYDQKLPPGVTEEDLAASGAAVRRLPPFQPEKFKSSLLRKGKG